jgi:hypothetical protein
MTEADWLTGTDPEPLLEYLRGRASERKLRLFAVGCCRRVWSAVSPMGQDTVHVAERCADGQAALRELLDAYDDSDAGWVEDAHQWAGRVANWATALGGQAALGGRAERRAGQADLLREIMGNPFQPAALDPAWLAFSDGLIPKLARAVYEERAFDRLPVVGDALEDAGCADQDVLGHCRSACEHVRGCWVLDLLLGKG